MNKQPLITIISSTYNSSETLRKCLDSVENQTYRNIEHIIIDGKSSDNTTDIIQEYESHTNSRISYWISEKDKGVYDAWNKAIPHIKGDWVCFLGSDDYYISEEVFSKISEKLSTVSEDTLIVYGKIVVFDKTPEDILYTRGCSWDVAKKDFFKGVMIPHPAVFHRASIFERYGGFDSRFKIAGDYELLMRVLKETEPEFVDMPVMMMQFGGASSNPKTMIQSGEEIVLAYKKNGITKTGGFKLKLTLLKMASAIAPNISARLSRTLLDAKIKNMH